MAPGELFIVADGKIRERKTWFQLPSMRRRAVVRPAEDPIRQAEAALRLAVQRQLVADVPVGCFLSGGLDSSAIATFAAEMQPGIPCFTIEIAGAQEVGAIEDLPYARQVAKGLGLPLHVVTVDSSGMARDLPDMVAMLDEPLADPAALNVLYISRLARRLGIKVLLSGTGGDDLFGGYRRHLAGRMDRYLCWIPGRMRRTIGAVGESAYQSAPVMRRAAKFLQGMDLSGDQRLVRYLEWPRRDDVRSLYSREFAQLIEGQEASAPLLEFLAELPESTSTLERQLALDQRFFLADHNLIYTDKMSMAAGVEVRVPFLDVDLADFAAQVPENLKLHRLEGKWILKKAMETYLPHEIVYRPKTGFGAPVRRWMQADLKGLMNDILGSTTFRERGLFDVRKVEQLLDKTGAGEVDGAYLLLAVMAMELWCQTYADQVPAPAM
jgi:asparagine synthase (glutamine-hydrolysing)